MRGAAAPLSRQDITKPQHAKKSLAHDCDLEPDELAALSECAQADEVDIETVLHGLVAQVESPRPRGRGKAGADREAKGCRCFDAVVAQGRPSGRSRRTHRMRPGTGRVHGQYQPPAGRRGAACGLLMNGTVILDLTPLGLVTQRPGKSPKADACRQWLRELALSGWTVNWKPGITRAKKKGLHLLVQALKGRIKEVPPPQVWETRIRTGWLCSHPAPQPSGRIIARLERGELSHKSTGRL